MGNTLLRRIGLLLIIVTAITLLFGCGDKKKRFYINNIVEAQDNIQIFIAPKGSIVRIVFESDEGLKEVTGEILLVGDQSLDLLVDSETITIRYDNIVEYEVVSIPGFEPEEPPKEEPPVSEDPDINDPSGNKCDYKYNFIHYRWYLQSLKNCIQEGGYLKIKVKKNNRKISLVIVCKLIR